MYMNKKLFIGIGLFAVIGGGIGLWYQYHSREKKEKKITTASVVVKEETPENLFSEIVSSLLIENCWKNERDFLSSLTRLYIKKSPDISWVNCLPTCQEDLMNKLETIGKLEEFEIELENKYKKRDSK